MVSKRVLLTGATGFLGSNILKRLLKDNYEVIIIKRSYSSISRINDLVNRIKFYDLDKNPMEDIFKVNKIDIIVHTATLYGRNDESVSEILSSNLFFPLKLLELAISYKINLFINTDTFFTTNMKFSNNLGYYVSSKKQFVDYAKNMIENKDIRFVNLNLHHLYGPKDNESKFIPSTIINLLSNKLEMDFTSGLQKKDFIFVEDVVSVYSLVIEKNESLDSNFINIDVGTGCSVSVKEMVLKINSICGSNTKLNFGAIPARENEPFESRADITVLKNLGWVQNYSIESGLAETIKSYKNETDKRIF